MNELPDVPFEKVLTYLPLDDLLRTKAVSKEFYRKIANFKVRCLCVSDYERESVIDKSRLVVGAFAQNFIDWFKFKSLFARSMLSGLRHLRVCGLNVREIKGDRSIGILNSFENLESLHLVRVFHLPSDSELILPKLRVLRLAYTGQFSMSLDAPRLSEIQVLDGSPQLHIVHAKSIETVLISDDLCLPLERFRNLKILHCKTFFRLSDTLLSTLSQLREIHLGVNYSVLEQLYAQKRRYRFSDLKIYYRGLCLANPQDHLEPTEHGLSKEVLRCIAENYSGLADQLPFIDTVFYQEIEVVPQVPIDFWPRLTNLREIHLSDRVENAERFLNFLARFPNIQTLVFYAADQLQALLDQVPLYCSPQFLQIGYDGDLNLDFISKFKDLLGLTLQNVTSNLIQEVFKQQRFIQSFWFVYRGTQCSIQSTRKRNQVILFTNGSERSFTDVDEVIAFLFDPNRENVD